MGLFDCGVKHQQSSLVVFCQLCLYWFFKFSWHGESRNLRSIWFSIVAGGMSSVQTYSVADDHVPSGVSIVFHQVLIPPGHFLATNFDNVDHKTDFVFQQFLRSDFPIIFWEKRFVLGWSCGRKTNLNWFLICSGPVAKICHRGFELADQNVFQNQNGFHQVPSPKSMNMVSMNPHADHRLARRQSASSLSTIESRYVYIERILWGSIIFSFHRINFFPMFRGSGTSVAVWWYLSLSRNFSRLVVFPFLVRFA